MQHDNQTCPKCEGKMEEGFILDRGIEGARPSYWIEGRFDDPPETSTIERITERLSQLVTQLGKSRLREGIRVVTLRCTGCGFLDSYARQPSE